LQKGCKQFSIMLDPETAAALSKLAAERGESQAEIIKMGIFLLSSTKVKSVPRPKRQRVWNEVKQDWEPFEELKGEKHEKK